MTPDSRTAWQRARRWLLLILLAGVIVVIWLSGLHHYLSFDQLQASKDALLDFKNAHPAASVLAFIALYALNVLLSLPVATLMTLLGGFLFGKWLGTLYVVIAATMGAAFIFLITRTSLGTALREKAGSTYKKIAHHMNDNAVSYMLFMRLVPLFPFFIVNIVPALFNVNLRTYILTTFFGIIPGTFVYVNLGEALGTIDTPEDLISPPVLIAFGLLGMIALIPALYKIWKTRYAPKS